MFLHEYLHGYFRGKLESDDPVILIGSSGRCCLFQLYNLDELLQISNMPGTFK